MERLKILGKLVCEKFYAYEEILRTQNCHRSYFLKNFLKNGKKTCEYLNRDWIKQSPRLISTFHFYEYKILLSTCIMLFIRYAESVAQSLSINMTSRWKWNPQRWPWWGPFSLLTYINLELAWLVGFFTFI